MKKSLIVLALLAAASAASAADLTLSGGSYKGTQRYGVGIETAPVYVNGNFSVVPFFELANLHRQDRDVVQLSATPMLRYHLTPALYAEGGIGASALSKTSLGDQRFSSAFQFQSTLGVGYRFNDALSVSYRLSHTSNGGIEKPNDGIDMQSVVVTLKF